MAATLHDPRYKVLVEHLVQARLNAGLTQQALAEKLGKPQSYIGKLETLERRLDVLEFFDLLDVLDLAAGRFAIKVAASIK